MSQFEIEIKSLLGSKENADKLKKDLKKLDPDLKLKSQNKQLNHYFIDGDTDLLYQKMTKHVSKRSREKFKKILTEGEDHSIRTRQLNDTVILVVKASIDDTTSSNGISRMEFESEVDMSLDELDKILLDCDFSYQAKWSRQREEYESNGMNICIDKNAGYGYLAEFEKVVEDTNEVEEIKRSLRDIMQKLEVEELQQDRLERMFAHYNENWPDYYGTDKIFVIE
ncbi:MAG: CYTH domain-containing protein [Candidatus Pacebacteria bacterium]|nr:CYTH domain-containing protein [Candidatus Paceibacterota bacterium]